ncbi:post-transcriptional regulator [Lysinibacillus piscis]|uniref:Post-transcriptional regulator ComN n=1 Tax=Lysinibacillus piscis TaxID=2518931 RepID=A0ABQ5NJH8_9BACI|nr:post-transcriptional regulator [Lysinibacillus sp. KH24]GLC88457.1 post-transcriptional regulator ComN [Lysinibacillus sp. KH24]
MEMLYAQLFEKVRPAIDSKIEEFKQFRYDTITGEELWRFCVQKKWRKKNVEQLPLHEVIATLFSVSPSDIVSFYQVEFLQSSEGFAQINIDDLQQLLHPMKI